MIWSGTPIFPISCKRAATSSRLRWIPSQPKLVAIPFARKATRLEWQSVEAQVNILQSLPIVRSAAWEFLKSPYYSSHGPRMISAESYSMLWGGCSSCDLWYIEQSSNTICSDRTLVPRVSQSILFWQYLCFTTEWRLIQQSVFKTETWQSVLVSDVDVCFKIKRHCRYTPNRIS